MAKDDKPSRLSTEICRAGVIKDPAFKAVSPPLYLSSTFGWANAATRPPYDYARSGNPTRGLLEETLAELEGGARGIVCATGMAAIGLPLTLLSPGDLMIAPHDCYGGTHRLLTALGKKGQFDVAFIDQTDEAALEAAFARSPKMVLVETPSNPLLRITDIEGVIRRAKKAGALTAADNTFLSPVLQRPLDLGCDIAIHSTTKYINGHSDVIGGAVITKSPDLGEELAWWANCTGVIGAPFDSYMTLRGLRTLSVRMERQQATAMFLAEKLAGDDRVSRVYYPGLKTHPGHDIAARQQKGFGAMLSAELAEGADTDKFLAALDVITLAESLGGFESLVCLPDSMTHAGMAPEARLEAGITPTLARFSIGLEDENDLWADLERALTAAMR